MKKRVAALLAALLALTGMAALAAGYSPAQGNEKNEVALLADMIASCDAPSEDFSAKIESDLAAIRAVSETDYRIAEAIATHWRAVYLDPDYPLYTYSGGERATELEQAGLPIGEAHAIVVLGFELKNGEMRPELMGRCDAAAAMARSFPDAIIVCSGGATGDNNPEKHTEAGMMKAYLTEHCGIDPSRIRIDERAMDTLENAVNTFRILKAEDIRTMTIVTSAYHQRRGQAIYNAVAAICRELYDYSVELVGSYSFEIEPSNEKLRQDHGIAARQIGQALNLSKESLDALRPRK